MWAIVSNGMVVWVCKLPRLFIVGSWTGRCTLCRDFCTPENSWWLPWIAKLNHLGFIEESHLSVGQQILLFQATCSRWWCVLPHTYLLHQNQSSTARQSVDIAFHRNKGGWYPSTQWKEWKVADSSGHTHPIGGTAPSPLGFLNSRPLGNILPPGWPFQHVHWPVDDNQRLGWERPQVFHETRANSWDEMVTHNVLRNSIILEHFVKD